MGIVIRIYESCVAALLKLDSYESAWHKVDKRVNMTPLVEGMKVIN